LLIRLSLVCCQVLHQSLTIHQGTWSIQDPQLCTRLLHILFFLRQDLRLSSLSQMRYPLWSCKSKCQWCKKLSVACLTNSLCTDEHSACHKFQYQWKSFGHWWDKSRTACSSCWSSFNTCLTFYMIVCTWPNCLLL
jgi:hypothetical protein